MSFLPEVIQDISIARGLWLNFAFLFSHRIRIEGSPRMSKKELIKQVAFICRKVRSTFDAMSHFYAISILLQTSPQYCYSVLTVIQQKHETRSKPPSSATKKPVSVEAIRRSVRDSLKEILIQR